MAEPPPTADAESAAPAPAAEQYQTLPLAYAASLQQHYAQQSAAAPDANARAYQSYQVAQYNAALRQAAYPASEPAKEKKKKAPANPHQKHGRWTEDEHQKFLGLMATYGRSWTKISQCMESRSEPQVRSHAQKHFLKLNRIEKANNPQADTIDGSLPNTSAPKRKKRKVEPGTPYGMAYDLSGLDAAQRAAILAAQPSAEEGVPSAMLQAVPGQPPAQPYYGQPGYPYPYQVAAQQQQYYNYLPFAALAPADAEAAQAASAPWTAAAQTPVPAPMTPEEQQRLYTTDPAAYQMRVLAQLAAAPSPPLGADPNSSFWFDPATGQIVCSTAPGAPVPLMQATPPVVPPVAPPADGDATA